MFDWRVLAASFVALLFISGIFITGFGIKDFFTNLGEKISEWMKSSPFEGFFSTTPKKIHKVEIIIRPKNIQLHPQEGISMRSNIFNIENFYGIVNISFFKKRIFLKETQTGLDFNAPLVNIEIEKIRLKSLIVNNVSFEVKPDIKTNMGTIEITDFSGKCLIDENSLILIGNVSILKTKIGDRSWELL